MSILTTLVWVLLMTLLLVLIFKKKFEILVPLSLIIGTFILFAFGFVHNIKLGYYLTWVSFLLIPLLLYKQRFNLKSVASNYFTFGFWVFLVLFMGISIYHRFTSFTGWDEFQHWGPMIKETLRLNQFYSVTESTLQMHKDYPPFVTMLQTLWCYLSGGYAEAYCYRAMSIFSISMFMPAFSYFNFKNKRNIIFAITSVAMILLINIFDYSLFQAIFETIYTDYLLGLIAAYVLFLCFSANEKLTNFDFFNLSISFTMLLMSKQMGIAFFALCLFVLIGLHIIRKIKHKMDYNVKYILLFILFLIVIPFLVNRIWPSFIAQYEPDIQFRLSHISLSSLFNIAFKGIGEPWQLITFNNYIDAIFNRPLIFTGITLTYFPINIIISIIIYTIIKIFSDSKKTYPSIISSAYIIGFLGYALTMLLLYISSFGPQEGPILASFERYINTYIYFGFTIIVMLLTFYAGKCVHKKLIYVFYVILILCSIPLVNNNWSLLKVKNSYMGYQNQIENLTLFESVDNNLHDGDKLLLVSQYQNDTIHILKYKYPLIKFEVITLGEPKYASDPDSQNLTIDQWLEKLSNFDYLYTYNTDEEFYQRYWLNIMDAPLLNERLYKITDGEVTLVE